MEREIDDLISQIRRNMANSNERQHWNEFLQAVSCGTRAIMRHEHDASYCPDDSEDIEWDGFGDDIDDMDDNYFDEVWDDLGF